MEWPLPRWSWGSLRRTSRRTATATMRSHTCHSPAREAAPVSTGAMTWRRVKGHLAVVDPQTVLSRTLRRDDGSHRLHLLTVGYSVADGGRDRSAAQARRRRSSHLGFSSCGLVPVHREPRNHWGSNRFVPQRSVGYLIMLTVYAHAMSSPIPFDEISPADNGMIKLVGLTGILSDRQRWNVYMERHRTVLRRLADRRRVDCDPRPPPVRHQQLFVDRISIPGLTSSTRG